jgi:hypothetical protein
MIRSIVGWMRVVAPPGAAIGLFLVLYLAPIVLAWVLTWRLGLPEIRGAFNPVRGMVVVMACVAYGVYRVLAFHPLFRPAYRSWLTLTPWTSDKPLPLGPLVLVPQDVVVLALMLALRHGAETGVREMPIVRPWAVPFALLIPYLLVHCAAFFGTGLRGTAFVSVFGLGLVIRLSFNPPVALAAAVAVYLWTWLGIRRELARFPWQIPAGWEKLGTALKSGRESPALGLGWPFDVLKPKPADGIRPTDALWVSLLAGWLLYACVIAAPFEHPVDRQGFVSFVFSVACLMSIVSRFFAYFWHYLPPIGLWGRIRTLRWIVPGYDQIFVAPLAAVLVAILAPYGLARMDVPPEIALPAVLPLVLWVVLGVGPSLERWRLTGSHRIVPMMMDRQQFIEL